jgi:uncharacterized lipoprotein NlpE involved in copper resistance
MTRKRRRLLNSLMMLTMEANGVIAMRIMKLMRGGQQARREAERMVSEKIAAAFEASASLMTGASANQIVRRYRSHVAANAKRLGGPKLGGRKRTRRRRN